MRCNTMVLSMILVASAASGSVVFTGGNGESGWSALLGQEYHGNGVGHFGGLPSQYSTHLAGTVLSGTQVSRAWIDSELGFDSDTRTLSLRATARTESGLHNNNESPIWISSYSSAAVSFINFAPVTLQIDAQGHVARNNGYVVESAVWLQRGAASEMGWWWRGESTDPAPFSVMLVLEPAEWTVVLVAQVHTTSQPRGIMPEPYASAMIDAQVSIIPSPCVLAVAGLCLARRRGTRLAPMASPQTRHGV